MNIDLEKITNINIEGIDNSDYPDYCDAYISSAELKINGVIRNLTEEELDYINEEKRDFVYEKVMEFIY